MQLKEKPELNQINQESEFWAKTYQLHRYGKKRESVTITLLKIIFIYFPLVAILLTILAATALSFYACGGGHNNARKSEGKQYVASMNRAQQAYFAEKSTFFNSVDALDLGIKTQTTNYNYSTHATKNAAFSYALSLSERKNLTSYVGAVFLVPVSPAAKNEKTTVSILCQADSPGNIQPANPILQNDVPVCAAGSSQVVR
ncbi:type IV pilin-like G/H family protein [Microcoleus sp. CAWBG58]|uniref:type IV pilin-like G/H family protein n=1 Tax=Microcoleus sp. CAWBG58 TaxID=2841651 RepID=UPI0025E5EDB7|nr:type IV pilin-like G/H family protein [Microcoleus sp. CAWBG58]